MLNDRRRTSCCQEAVLLFWLPVLHKVFGMVCAVEAAAKALAPFWSTASQLAYLLRMDVGVWLVSTSPIWCLLAPDAQQRRGSLPTPVSASACRYTCTSAGSSAPCICGLQQAPRCCAWRCVGPELSAIHVSPSMQTLHLTWPQLSTMHDRVFETMHAGV